MKKEKIQNAVAALKALFADEQAAGDTAPADNLKDYTTATGAVLKVDKLETGGKVFKDDGTTPEVAGEYTMADGTKVTVDESGTITAVTAPAAMGAQPDANAAAAFAAQFAEQKESTERLIADLRTELAAAETARQKDAASFKTGMAQLCDLMAQFAEAPADDPVQTPAGADKGETKKERGVRLLQAAKAAKANK